MNIIDIDVIYTDTTQTYIQITEITEITNIYKDTYTDIYTDIQRF